MANFRQGCSKLCKPRTTRRQPGLLAIALCTSWPGSLLSIYQGICSAAVHCCTAASGLFASISPMQQGLHIGPQQNRGEMQ